MANNLNTTLWVKGCCWYAPDSPLLDLRGISAPAAAITALAGYINTCFNLLEFFNSSLGASSLAQEQLVQQLGAVNAPVES
jgi:hypothetical protein